MAGLASMAASLPYAELTSYPGAGAKIKMRSAVSPGLQCHEAPERWSDSRPPQDDP
jgi:hypothetical protein